MIDDPIVAEVRAIRDRHAAKFNYDLDAIHRDLKDREKASGRTYVRYPPRLCQPGARPADVSDAEPNHRMQQTGASGAVGEGCDEEGVRPGGHGSGNRKKQPLRQQADLHVR